MSCCIDKNKLRARDLTDVVTIQTAQDTHNANGSITRTWDGTSYSRWCKVESTGGAEPDQFREIEGHATYRFAIRYDSALAAALTPGHRIVHDDGRIFDIIRVANSAPERIDIVANDYGPITTTDGLTYSGTDYDAIIRNEAIEERYTDAGILTARILPALVRISDFTPGITAQGATCTINTRTYRIREVIRAQRGDWYKLMLQEEHAE